jgi:hypothetical protein
MASMVADSENQQLSVITIWSLACDNPDYIGVLMSDVLPTAHHEFWRPPVVNGAIPISSGLAEVCKGCGAEFMIGSSFCHLCGTDRRSPLAEVNLGWSRYLDVQNIKSYLGLPNPSFVAFLIGVACLLAALMVGVIYNIQNFGDFQAVQFWRVQWLLGAVAAFAGGILLKRQGKS